jgi:hypothetical protein
MSNNDFGNLPGNPYATVVSPEMQPTAGKPVSLTVFGIINIVWGALFLCLSIVGIGQMFLLDAMRAGMPNPALDVIHDNPAVFFFMIALNAFNFIFSAVLIFGGIGLLSGKPYGRSLSISYAIYGIVSPVLNAIFSLVFMMGPVLERAEAMPDGPEKAGATIGAIGGVAGNVCMMIYPIVLLVFMMRGPVVNYMRAQRRA